MFGTPVACFASGRRNVYRQDLHQLDVLHRKLLRQVCGPPGSIDWSSPWHEILHEWNGKVARMTAANAMRPWSDTCLLQYWKLGSYVARLPAERWAKRVLEWEPDGRRSQGRPREVWDSKLAVFCTTNNLGRWEAAARDSTAWLAMADDFIMSIAAS